MIFIGASFINKILNIKPLLVQYLITIEIIKKKKRRNSTNKFKKN